MEFEVEVMPCKLHSSSKLSNLKLMYACKLGTYVALDFQRWKLKSIAILVLDRGGV